MVVPGLWLDFAPVIIRQTRVGSTEHLRLQLDGITEHMAVADQQGWRTVIIVDLSYAPQATREERRIEAEWRTRHEAMIRRVSLGAAMLVPNQFIRGALTAILWLHPPPNGYIVTLRLSHAIDWAIATLASDGIAAPDRLVHDRASAEREIRARLRRT